MKAIRFAASIGIKEVITTDTDPRSEWARELSYREQVFIIAEKLYTPARMAEDHGVRILLEPHGPITDSIQGLQDVMIDSGIPIRLASTLIPETAG